VLACDLASSQPAAGVSIILALKGANNEKALYIFPSLSGLFATKKRRKIRADANSNELLQSSSNAGFLQKGE